MVFDFLQRVAAAWHVDKRRVHFGGYSQGAFMTWRMLCAHSDVIASAAPIAGSGCSFSGADMPAREVPVFFTHGTTDGLVPFTYAVTERDAMVAALTMHETTTIASGPDYSWKRYENGAGTVLEFVQHDWQTTFMLGPAALRGHCFPGSGEFLGCGAGNPFNWGQKVLEFYQAHPMK